jgi:hypothetical protein
MASVSIRGAGVALMGVLLCSISTAEAGVTAAQKCETAKLKAAGKYDLCRLLTQAKAAKSGAMPDFSACDAKYSAKWSQAETNAGGMCLSSGDAATVQAFLSQGTTAVGVALAGKPLPACGNGVIDPGEQCDQSNLNGQTCSLQGFAGGVLTCGAGCVFDTSGCSAARFIDNGDGTVSDLQTGLMWEQKTAGHCVFNLIACFSDADCVGNGGGGVCMPCLHCVNATYTWASLASPNLPTGTAFTDFLYQLNQCDPLLRPGAGFATYCDWRLPTEGELSLIEDFTVAGCRSGSPCISAVFGPTQADYYWSATDAHFDPRFAYAEDFYDASRGNDEFKTDAFYVRAVRGGCNADYHLDCAQ